MHTLSKKELSDCFVLYIKYVESEKTLLQFVEIEVYKCFNSGCKNFNIDMQNEVLYVVAHIMMFHKQWKKCDVCQ